ncbi:hypothetical protein CSUB01_02726 [Colletotrichum sublineola]|uniref:Uncharacterized protein n=1 Tax=Colletotrichum sublineola TaxID=1173701 RepID=A0A066X4R4_COLSU|nr:hypothetical protein CSUB01_02726 [Colletotrichum sublineola]
MVFGSSGIGGGRPGAPMGAEHLTHPPIGIRRSSIASGSGGVPLAWKEEDWAPITSSRGRVDSRARPLVKREGRRDGGPVRGRRVPYHTDIHWGQRCALIRVENTHVAVRMPGTHAQVCWGNTLRQLAASDLQHAEVPQIAGARASPGLGAAAAYAAVEQPSRRRFLAVVFMLSLSARWHIPHFGSAGRRQVAPGANKQC